MLTTQEEVKIVSGEVEDIMDFLKLSVIEMKFQQLECELGLKGSLKHCKINE
jgi:stalled ribosome rescue protein Dom34